MKFTHHSEKIQCLRIDWLDHYCTGYWNKRRIAHTLSVCSTWIAEEASRNLMVECVKWEWGSELGKKDRPFNVQGFVYWQLCYIKYLVSSPLLSNLPLVPHQLPEFIQACLPSWSTWRGRSSVLLFRSRTNAVSRQLPLMLSEPFFLERICLCLEFLSFSSSDLIFSLFLGQGFVRVLHFYKSYQSYLSNCIKETTYELFRDSFWRERRILSGYAAPESS